MRTLTVLSVFLLGLGAIVVFGNVSAQAQYQYQPVPPQPAVLVEPDVVQITPAPLQPGNNRQPMAIPPQFQPPPNDRQPPWMQQQGAGQRQQPGGPPRMQGNGMQGPRPVRQGQPGQQPGGMQGNPGMQPGQPGGGMNANMTPQIMARLRALDANGNGILEPNEIPDNQRARMAAMAQRFGIDINGPVNLADVERRITQGMANNANNQPPDPSAGRQPRQQPVEPLVKPFGEPRPAETAVVGFGQREPVSPNTLPAGAGGRPRNMAAQANQQQQVAQAVRDANTVKQSGPYDHIPQAVRDNRNFSWFFDADTDKDGQLTMSEYVNALGGVWTAELAAEFRFLDRNNDGFATVDEALTSIKEKDAEIAQKAKEQQPAVGPRPGQPVIVRPTPPNARSTGNIQAGNNQGGQERQPSTIPSNTRRQRESPSRDSQ